MKNTLKLGEIAYTAKTKENSVEIECSLQEKEGINFITLKKEKFLDLSLCGGIWDANHNDYVSCGQNIDEIAKLFPTTKVKRIKEIWERYHLNSLKPGTQKQCQLIDAWRKENKIERFAYTEEFEYLKGINMDFDNGIKWGSVWFFEPIPEDIINEIKLVFHLV